MNKYKLQKAYSTFLLISLLLIVIVSSTKLSDSGSCSHRCAECKVKGDYKWCQKCIQSSHSSTSKTNGKCKGHHSPIPDCLIVESINGNQSCHQCNEGHTAHQKILEDGTIIKKCVPFLDRNTRSIRINKNGEPEVGSCSPGYVPVQSRCRPVPQKDFIIIPNCTAYSSIGKCKKCQSGYIISNLTSYSDNRVNYARKKNYCQKINHIKGCKTYSYLIDKKYCSKGCDWESGYFSVDGFPDKNFQISGQVCYNPKTKHYAHQINRELRAD